MLHVTQPDYWRKAKNQTLACEKQVHFFLTGENLRNQICPNKTLQKRVLLFCLAVILIGFTPYIWKGVHLRFYIL